MDLSLSVVPTELGRRKDEGQTIIHYGFLLVGQHQVLMAVRRKKNDRGEVYTVMGKSSLTHFHAKHSEVYKYVQGRKNSRFPRNDAEISTIASDHWEALIMRPPAAGEKGESRAEA